MHRHSSTSATAPTKSSSSGISILLVSLQGRSDHAGGCGPAGLLQADQGLGERGGKPVCQRVRGGQLGLRSALEREGRALVNQGITGLHAAIHDIGTSASQAVQVARSISARSSIKVATVILITLERN